MIKIKIFDTTDSCLPKIIKKGEWVDLINAENVKLKAGVESTKISLGIISQLPKGYEAWILPRSSTYSKYFITQVNSMGVIDSSYCGKNDIWKMNVKAHKDVFIPKGKRIAQFRIQLSQKATFWKKLKWFFSSGIKIVQIDKITEESRGGFGSTGEDKI